MSAPLLSITHQPPAETEKEKSGAWVKKLIHTRSLEELGAMTTIGVGKLWP
jgi:hypothetical protein